MSNNIEIREYSPNFEEITEPQKVFIADNAVEIHNRGNTNVKIDSYTLEPEQYIRTPFTEPQNVCVWNFYLKFEDENIVDTGAVKKLVSIIRTNFHKKQLSNYKSK